MLEVRNLCVSYGQHQALQDVSVRVAPGEIVVILGANGAGKSTLLRAISGICEGHHSGAVEMDGHPILGQSPDKIVGHGIALVPEGRGIFGDLSVIENLRLGAYCERARGDEAASLERMLSLFPKLGERKSQIARTMSGGEQQMVAISRAMMSSPKILMLDEPSLGLSPLLCKELFANLTEVRKSGIGILLVEQNARQSLAIADRGYLLENAHIVHQDSAASLRNDPAVQKSYLGAGAAKTGQSTPAPIPVGLSPDDIAAQAMAFVTPDPPTTPAAQVVAKKTVTINGPPPRRSADELAGTSIDGLVGSAARQAGRAPAPAPHSTAGGANTAGAHSETQANPARPAQKEIKRRANVATTAISHDDRLRAALENIEQAAKRARKTVRSRTPR